ncbi:MAG: peptidase M19, partial [Spirochaetes bacterium]
MNTKSKNYKDFQSKEIFIDGLNASFFLNPNVFRNLKKGNVTAVNGTIAAWHNFTETMEMIGSLMTILDASKDSIFLVERAVDIVDAKRTGRTGFIMGFQDTAPLEGKLYTLRLFQKLGIRVIQLTYNTTNLVGSGFMTKDEGITSFGQEVIEEMNRLGILIDISHCGEKTSAMAVEISVKPLAVTHANPYSFCPHPRNKSDSVLKAVAKKGGVVGINAFPAMLKTSGQASLEDYLNAIDYTVNLIGIDHTALGPDFMEEMPNEIADIVLKDIPAETREKMKKMPALKNFESISKAPEVTDGLFRRGYSEDEVRKIIGLN